MKQVKTAEDLSESLLLKTEEEVIHDVPASYHQVLMNYSNLKVLNDNIANLEKLHQILKRQYENDFVKQTDVRRLKVTLTNLKTQRETLRNGIDVQQRILKIISGIPVDKELVLDTAIVNKIDFQKPVMPEFIMDILPTYKALKKQSDKAAFYPNLAAFGQFTYSSYATQFKFDKFSKMNLNFQKKAENMLIAILQKKLFDMQLLWRAGKVEIDEIDISYDFQFWGKYIASCPFISPITENEIEMIKEYLMFENDAEQFDQYSGIAWQDYDRIMTKDENGQPANLPDWYEFYDLRMGSGTLLVLPNHRGNKEGFYLTLNREEIQRNNPPRTYCQIDARPIICGYGKDLIDFSRYFESDEYFIELFKYYDFYEEKENRDPYFDDINEASNYYLQPTDPFILRTI